MSDFNLTELFPDEAFALVEGSGDELVERLGLPSIRQVVTDVLCGKNIREATEPLTRERIGMLNAALIAAYVQARQKDTDFPNDLAAKATNEHRVRGKPERERKVLRWMAGLTKKQVQNVLRSDDKAWDRYTERFQEDLEILAKQAADLYGPLNGEISLKEEDPATIDWLWSLYLATAIGSQERGTRGAEKSLYGKLFEKLVLAGVLHLMGLSLVEPDDVTSPGVFWLSSRGAKRESDATALLGEGEGVRFDIGFIGEGNTEISLDKASRFERQIELSGANHFMHTLIIVDQIGSGSRIVEIAKEIDATILQMSGSFWPRQLGEKLEEVAAEFESPLKDVPDSEMGSVIEAGIAGAPFETILAIVEEEILEDDEEELQDEDV